jgi:hypothetical protein
MCPHTTVFVSACRINEHAVKVEALQTSGAAARGVTYYILHLLNMCSHNTIYILYIWPHTTIDAVKVEGLQALLLLLYMCPHTTICVLLLLYMCPRTTTFVSSYCYTCVLMLLCMCSHTSINVSSYYYCTCVLILVYI